MTDTIAVSRPGATVPVAPLDDCTPTSRAEQRYLAAVQELVDDALAHGHTEVLVDVLTWNVARVCFAYGPGGTGDVLRRVGAHLCSLDERSTAEREAKAARREGRLPQ